MQLAQFNRNSGLWLLIGLAGFVVGCDLGGHEAPAAPKGSGAAIKEDIKSTQKERIEGHRGGKKVGAKSAGPG
jgi:hypothetical protein